MATLSMLLQSFMQRAKVGTQTLSNLTGIPRASINNWHDGSAQRPRHWRPLLQIAQTLALNVTEANALLAAADYPPVTQLAATLAPEHPDRRYLQLWLNSTPPALEVDRRLLTLEARLAQTQAPSTPLRHQLRAPAADFVGRTGAITTLLPVLRRAQHGAVAAISGVRGMGGIGKTELAILVAHQLSDTFPDAQIVLNLRGASANPLPAVQALQQVIHAFTPGEKLPDDLDALQQRYCAVLHGQRALILADDARDVAQVRWLLPPSGCALLVTSRVRFSLPGMTTVDLEQLTEPEAITLLHGICERLSAGEAQALAQACGHLPLALRISGNLLHNDPALAVADYLARLRDERQRLDHLGDPDDPQFNVTASLALSYVQLDGATRQVFRQLGVFVSDFATELAVMVVEAPESGSVEAALHLLLRRNLVMYDVVRVRWRLHDLMRDLALNYLEIAGEREAAMWRYTQAAVQIAEEIQAQYRAGGEAVLTALARFDAERPHIDTARMWAVTHVGTTDGDTLLVREALATLLIAPLRYDRQHERIPHLELVCLVAQQLGERHAEGHILNALGSAYMELGEIRHAVRHFEQVLTIMRAIGDWRGEGQALSDVGLAYALMGETRRAIPSIEWALTIAQERGHRLLESYALNTLGLAWVLAGEAHNAIPAIEHGLTIVRTMGDQRGEGQTLSNLGLAYGLIGEARRAIPIIEQALMIASTITHRFLQGYALTSLGNAFILTGEAPRAIPVIEQALTIARESGNRLLEGYALTSLGATYLELGEGLWAISALEHALPIMREIGDQRGEGQALSDLGNAYILVGEARRAISVIEQALTIARVIAHRLIEGYALTSLGNAYIELGETQPAVACSEEALTIFQDAGDLRQEGYALSILGRAAVCQDELAHALMLFDQAQAIFQKVGDRHGEAMCRWHAGIILAQRGECERALLHLRAAVAYEREIGHAKAEEHTALVVRLEAGETLPVELHIPTHQRSIGADSDQPMANNA